MIHETAIVQAGAQIDENVEIGPYAIIGENVSIGAGTTVGPHAVIEGITEIGRDNRIFQFASVGAAPQDLKYHGEETRLRIGERNTIREFVTIHRGTRKRRRRNRRRRRRPVYGLLPCCSRQPGRQPGNPRQWSHLGRACPGRRFCHSGWSQCRAPVYPHRVPRHDQRRRDGGPGYSRPIPSPRGTAPALSVSI